MSCQELDQPRMITRIFREKVEREVIRIFNCFYTHYYETFTRIVRDNLSRQYPFLKHDPEFYSSMGFADGLMTFRQYMTQEDFVERGARLSSFFYRFCVNKVLTHARKQTGEQKIQSNFIKDTKSEWLPAVDAIDLVNEDQAILLKAMNMMDEKKKRYITLRKYYKYSDEDIAGIMGVSPKSVPNEVYRAFSKLRDICHTLKDKK